MKLLFFYRKRYPNAFSIERLFDQLAEVIQRRGIPLAKLEAPHYNNSFTNLRKNKIWARSRVQSEGDGAALVKHITGDITSIVSAFSGPTVITIHDTNPLIRFPRTSLKHWFYRYTMFQWPARRADAVTVISNKTMQEMLEFTNCPKEKIHFIPNFVDPSFVLAPKPFNKEYPTILQVGTKYYKGLDRLAKAIQGIPCRLEIIGEPTAEHSELLKSLKIDFHWSAGISDEELRQRYRDCDIMSMISTYEGFGLPIIEAQMTGRPVITSNISPHKDVAGEGGAMLVDPHDIEAIRSAVLRIIQDDEARESLIERGNINAAKYNIENIATQYIELYQSLI